jgi:hypothetical protein
MQFYIIKIVPGRGEGIQGVFFETFKTRGGNGKFSGIP